MSPNADVIIGITARNKKWAMRDYGPPMSTTPRDRPWEGQPLPCSQPCSLHPSGHLQCASYATPVAPVGLSQKCIAWQPPCSGPTTPSERKIKGSGAFASRMGQGKNKNSASRLARFSVFFCQSQLTGIIGAHPSPPWVVSLQPSHACPAAEI